jgi:hypothetical protein
MLYKNNGYPNDLNNNEHGSDIKVIHANGKVTYQKATYWPDISKKYHLRGKSAGKGR